MKIKIILTIIVVIILAITILSLIKKKEPISDIESFSFSYSVGYSINAYVIYMLDHKDSKYKASIKPNEVAEEKTVEIEVDKKTVNKIENVLKKYHVENWDGFNKSNKHVLDGNSFSLNIKMKNRQITASGYMMWTKNYAKVRQELDNIFLNMYKNHN